MKNSNEMFYRVNENGDAVVLNCEDGSAVTKIDADVYPVGSAFSTRYEHAEGIVLTVSDAESIGIQAE